jgi:hypothetical protein
MKAFTLTAFSLGVLAAILTLAGCGNNGMQSQFASSQTRSQTSTTNIRHATTGKKKVGKFWWVTNVVSVAPGVGRTIDAVCPTAFVPTGGGYVEEAAFGLNPFIVYGSSPFNSGSTFSWSVIIFNVEPPSFGSVPVAVYAICAKKT